MADYKRKIKLRKLIKNILGDQMEKSYKPKILLVHNFYKIPGGEDTVFINEKRLLEDNGHVVFTYTRNNQEINRLNWLGKLAYPLNTIFSIKTYREVKKVIIDNKIDIVHVHNTWPLISPSIYYSAFHLNVPVVQTIHNFRMLCPGATLYHNGKICEDSIQKGLRSSLKLRIYKGSYTHTLISALTLKIHRQVNTYKNINYIFLTDFNKKKILELNNGRHTIIDEKKTFIKPNFVNIEKNIIPFEERKNQFVFAGRLDKLKGIDLLLESWKEIKDSNLIVCGTGPEENWCRNYIENNNLTNVKMMGYVSNDQVMEIIAESKALILPTQWYEGFPMTIVESWASGTPVIGSNIGNVDSLIEDGVTGLKFQYNSVEGLRESIKRLTDMVSLCKKEYEESYRPNSNYQQLLHIYRHCKG